MDIFSYRIDTLIFVLPGLWLVWLIVGESVLNANFNNGHLFFNNISSPYLLNVGVLHILFSSVILNRRVLAISFSRLMPPIWLHLTVSLDEVTLAEDLTISNRLLQLFLQLHDSFLDVYFVLLNFGMVQMHSLVKFILIFTNLTVYVAC